MLPRVLRASAAAAVRQFSTRADAALATAPEKLSREGEDVSMNRSTSKSTGRDTLGRRLFALVYSKRSAAITIRKWKEEGHDVRKYELNRIVRELRKLKRYKHALEVCEWMRLQEDMKLVPGDFAVHLDLIAKIRGLNSAEKFFEDLPEKMRDPATCSALLHTYVQYNEYNKAEAVMKKMSESGFLTSPLPYNHMLSLYVSTGDLQKVPELIKEVKKTTSPDIVTYNLWLAACASQNLIDTAEKVFQELSSKAKLEPDWVTYSTMASIYIKNSFHENAESALKEMEKKINKNIRVAYSSLISLHTALGNKNDVHRIWKKMKSTYRKLNDSEYTCMINSLLKLKVIEGAEELYTEWESISPTKDTRVPNLLLAAYINNDQMEKAEAFHNRMVQNDIVPGYTTWELLTYGYLKQKQVDKVLECFQKAVKSVRKWDPDEKLVQEISSVIKEFGDVVDAEKLLATLRRAGYVNTETYNSLLRTYAKAGKMPIIMAERMKKDNVEMDEETKRLLRLTSTMRVSEIPSDL
ncbi:pentatricopeptide repeat-containing protein At4g02820, mitochondrial [Andrographis paniculata]|uniref:pentatricopeptide repeat-containing protein At4g02820, mitochondrial n=1 Tax=Andrographis paniculata TaxID=175694 RepID=UPI0021E8C0FD|nr:pentatricopeptide repeat-containing protein At4g02820, mitochondrial [Andrographis paniculata]